jgi:hypothetical protein
MVSSKAIGAKRGAARFAAGNGLPPRGGIVSRGWNFPKACRRSGEAQGLQPSPLCPAVIREGADADRAEFRAARPDRWKAQETSIVVGVGMLLLIGRREK